MAFLDETGTAYLWSKATGKFAEKTSVPTTVAQLTDASDYAKAADVPEKVSDLTNDSEFQTSTQVESAINAKIAGVYKYKTSVANRAALPTQDQVVGDVYDLQDTGMNVAWNGTAWDDLGTTVTISAITNAQIDTITGA